MTPTDEVMETQRELSGLLSQLEASPERPRYAMGQRASVSIRVTAAPEEKNRYRIDIVCFAFGSLDARWGDCEAVLRDATGRRHILRLDSRGRGMALATLPAGAVLSGVKFGTNSSVTELLAAAARTDVGDLFREVSKDFMTSDGRVKATVTGTIGGDLSVVFLAPWKYLDLRKARILFTFFTDVGTKLNGEVRMSRDQRDDQQAAAFWTGNQMQLRPAGQTAESKSDSATIGFEFEVRSVDGENEDA